MNMETQRSHRRYESPLRAELAEQTRTRILLGLIRVMSRGVRDLSMPDVAREAGVALRTVYRYFPTKYDLLAALSDYADEQLGGQTTAGYPETPAALAATISAAFLAQDNWSDSLLAALTSPLGGEVRRTISRPQKHQTFARALSPLTGRLPEPDRTHLFNAVMMIANRYALQACKNDLGLSAEQAGETVSWLIRALTRLANCPDTAPEP